MNSTPSEETRAFPHTGYATDKEVASYFGVSINTVWKWARKHPDTLTAYKLGPNTTRWDAEQVREFPHAAKGK